MHLSGFVRHILIFMLSAWLGGVSSAHAFAEQAFAGQALAAQAAIDGSPTEALHTIPPVAKTGIRESARVSQRRILFILAGSKVHGRSALPASVGFGEVVHAWDTFQAAGHSVDFVSPDGGAVPILDRSMRSMAAGPTPKSTVTGQNYASAKPVAEAAVEVLRKLADR